MTTSKSLFWSTIDKFGVQTFALFVSIFTARMLSPEDFAVIASLAIFTALSNIIVDSGLSAALIRRNANTESEYSAAMIFNIIVGLILYIFLCFSSAFLAKYLKMPEINPLARLVFVSIVINSLGIVQNVILTRNMEFKKISIANLTSAIVSSVVTITLIVMGYTYWAIAWQQVSFATTRTLMLWALSHWTPKAKPDFSVITSTFSFSAFLLATSIINIIVKYIYNLKIPIILPKSELGYYDRARKFQEIPSMVVASAIQSVAYPILSKLNNDRQEQLAFARKTMQISAFLIFPIMLGIIAIIKNLTIVVLTEKWLPMIPYFQTLCIVGIFFPFQNLSLTILNAIGKSNINFTLEIIRNSITILLFLLMSATVKQMLIGLAIATFISYCINIFVIKYYLGYSIIYHIKDIMPYALISTVMYCMTMLIDKINITLFDCQTTNIISKLIVQILVGGAFYYLATYITGIQIIKELHSTIKSFFNNRKTL